MHLSDSWDDFRKGDSRFLRRFVPPKARRRRLANTTSLFYAVQAELLESRILLSVGGIVGQLNPDPPKGPPQPSPSNSASPPTIVDANVDPPNGNARTTATVSVPDQAAGSSPALSENVDVTTVASLTSPPVADPPNDTPPVTDPPNDAPPVDTPAGKGPVVVDPPNDTPPVTDPPNDAPPVGLPAHVNSFAVSQLASPPVADPPNDTPPVTDPPNDAPPVEVPAATGPPVDTPPVINPPIDAPPVEVPAASGPPVGDPPNDTPPVTDPPNDAPPVGWPLFFDTFFASFTKLPTNIPFG